MCVRRRADAGVLKGALIFVTIAMRELVSLVREYNVSFQSMFWFVFGFGDFFLKISYVGMYKI